MTYTVEQWFKVEFHQGADPYGTPLNPTAVLLDFADSASNTPLPWAKPNLVLAYRMTLTRADTITASTYAPLTVANEADDQRAGAWDRGHHANHLAAMRHQDADHRDHGTGATWNETTGHDRDSCNRWQKSNTLNSDKLSPWEPAKAKDRSEYTSHWIMKTPYRDAVPAMPWFSVNLYGSVYDDEAMREALRQTDTATNVSLAGLGEPYTPRAWDAQVFSFGYTPPARPSVPHDVPMGITARQANTHDNDHRIPWGAGDTVWRDWNLPYPVEDNTPPPEPTEPPERRTVYLIMNTLQITDVATGTPLDVQNVRISLDIDSISWQFTGTLYGQGSLALVQPDNQGMKDIQVIINGHTWVFAIERYTSDERFPTKKFNITGVSRTQYMASPFAPARSYTNTLATTAAQAATAELQNTGFTLTWPTGGDATLPDWPIPAGALSYRDKSPAQVIAQIVKAAGGVMVPNLASDGWTIQPRYKVPSWQWASATPDAEIYIGMIRSRSAQYEPGHAYNACYVSGITQGVAVDVHRQGSGGTDPMPDIFDDLITDPQPAISRGRNELAATGPKVLENLEVIIPEQAAAPGVLVPGMLAKITHDNPDQDYWALVLGNSLAANGAGGAAVYQTVTLERTA